VILSLETSTFFCSVAIHLQGQLVASSHLHRQQATASQLSVMIDQVCSLAGCTHQQLEAVAVSAGPGSYTGLRIGVATAKGICYGINKPLIAVPTLEIMAAQMAPYNMANAWLCPMLDARRMEVYCQLFDGSLLAKSRVEAKVVEAGSFEMELNQHPVMFFGNGAAKCREVIAHAAATFIEGVHPSADKMGELAFARWTQRLVEDLTTYEPYYLKDFVAKTPQAK
jgi:tRNA threonylcarbamoyladenosine biosynthesis protein TsaB